MDTIRVLLADDQNIIREGIRSLLKDYDDIEIIGEAADGKQLVELTQTLEPDIVLTDIRMPIMDGVQAAHLIKQQKPNTTIIMLTTFDDDEYIIEAMTGGAAGYLLKDISSNQLVQALRDSMQGNLILPGRIAAKITARLSSKDVAGRNDGVGTVTEASASIVTSGADERASNHAGTVSEAASRPDYKLENFSERERDIISLLLQGCSNRDIADKLFLTVGTVKNYLSQIYQKLDVSDRANAVIKLQKLFK